MSLGCLSCHRWLPRTDSHRCQPQPNHQQRQQHRKLRATPRCSRNWSGTLVRPPTNQMKWEEDGSDHHKPNKAHHRRLNTLMDIREVANTLGFDEDGGGCWDDQPRLVRSCGMRRDWSFEDLAGVEIRPRREVGEGRNWQ